LSELPQWLFEVSRDDHFFEDVWKVSNRCEAAGG